MIGRADKEVYIENKTISEASTISSKIVLCSLSNLFSDKIELEYQAEESFILSPEIFFELVFLTAVSIESVRNKSWEFDIDSIGELFFEKQTYLKKGEKLRLIIDRTTLFDGILFDIILLNAGQVFGLKLQRSDENYSYVNALRYAHIFKNLLCTQFFTGRYVKDSSISIKNIQVNNIIVKKGFELQFMVKGSYSHGFSGVVLCHNEEVLTASRIVVNCDYALPIFEQALSSLRDMTLFYIQG